MTIEEAKAKLVDLGVVPAQAWNVVREPSKLLILRHQKHLDSAMVDSIIVRRVNSDERVVTMTIPEAEELSNALRSALYGVNCPRCTWTHSESVPPCPPQEVS